MKELFSMKGRIGRGRFFLNGIISTVVLIAFIGLGVMLRDSMKNDTLLIIFAIIGFAYMIPVEICDTVKRFHDLDRPGSHYFLLMIPFYGLFLSFVLLLQKGTEGSNRFGEDPLIKG